MKEVIKTAVSLFLKLILVNFMCAIVVLSVSILANGLFAEEVGYTALGVKEGEEQSETLYTYRYDEGEDTKRADYEAQGYEIVEYSLKELSRKGNIISTAVAQFLTFCLLCSFVYPINWELGTKDSNLVKFKHKEADTLKGLKIGLFAIIPAVLLLVFLFATKNNLTAGVSTAIYKLMNSSLYGFIDIADGHAVAFGELSAWNFLALAAVQLVIPIVSFISYFLGFKNISIGEKFVYRKEKKRR